MRACGSSLPICFGHIVRRIQAIAAWAHRSPPPTRLKPLRLRAQVTSTWGSSRVGRAVNRCHRSDGAKVSSCVCGTHTIRRGNSANPSGPADAVRDGSPRSPGDSCQEPRSSRVPQDCGPRFDSRQTSRNSAPIRPCADDEEEPRYHRPGLEQSHAPTCGANTKRMQEPSYRPSSCRPECVERCGQRGMSLTGAPAEPGSTRRHHRPSRELA